MGARRECFEPRILSLLLYLTLILYGGGVEGRGGGVELRARQRYPRSLLHCCDTCCIVADHRVLYELHLGLYAGVACHLILSVLLCCCVVRCMLCYCTTGHTLYVFVRCVVCFRDDDSLDPQQIRVETEQCHQLWGEMGADLGYYVSGKRGDSVVHSG